ncbi:efflux transporter outer membrane subunit [Ramlibacter alkalitolerans]|uniref:Efflux transporter outer membrane subunit n=1 Tax=Ramlibacter alkalitolerans TaxID=2039631 RepID=A0ABS1JW71_9BURK|nr:efflux transporter outer membrane subunit [Ramlibacter alkalitolerans]MBL0428447.1 efflux transporter outer membrane subunit [Ramlibacter alkalitolerans]
MQLPPSSRPLLALLASSLALAGCAPLPLAPAYEVPAIDTPMEFKEGQGAWVRAAPADALERGAWWELFDDPYLNDLAQQVAVSNQNVAAAVAAYAQARALTREQRASLFPRVDLDVRSNRTGGPDTPSRSTYSWNIGASWEPDVFGRLRLAVDSARSGEQVAEADLAAARLAAQGELAANYFGLRETDVLYRLQSETTAGYTRSLQITRNRYEAGVVARTDVLQAESQLANSQADLLTLERQRANFEHAVAVLVGKAPANFSIPVDPKWSVKVPAIPVEVPSTLLQRRPDIAAAERSVARANAQIGIERAALFPSLNLTGSIGSSAASIGDLFKVSTLVWALGSSVAQTLFDAGARNARVEQARFALDESAARYRQTVLTAFQDVEDQLVGLRVLTQQQGLRAQASRASGLVEQQVLNRYEAGQVGYTEVITAQQNAAAARRALVQAQIDHQLAAVSLIQALGGGWGGFGSMAATSP